MFDPTLSFTRLCQQLQVGLQKKLFNSIKKNPVVFFISCINWLVGNTALLHASLTFEF